MPCYLRCQDADRVALAAARPGESTGDQGETEWQPVAAQLAHARVKPDYLAGGYTGAMPMYYER